MILVFTKKWAKVLEDLVTPTGVVCIAVTVEKQLFWPFVDGKLIGQLHTAVTREPEHFDHCHSELTGAVLSPEEITGACN